MPPQAWGEWSHAFENEAWARTAFDPYAIAGDPAGAYVYVANLGSSTVSLYSIGAAGALTSIGSLVIISRQITKMSF